MNSEAETVRREAFNALAESYNDFINSTVRSLWEAYRETINTPYRKMTMAERKLDDAFRQHVLSISVSDNAITYKTVAGSFSAPFYLDEV